MLHHHVKPHHHLTIWVVTALQVIFALVVYTDASVLAAREASDRETEPSQETQEFFGGKVKKETGSLPAECQRADARPAPLNTDTFPPESSRATSSSQPKVWDTFERVKPSESPISAQTSGNDYSSSAYPSSSPYPSGYPTSYSPSESPSASSSYASSGSQSPMGEEQYRAMSEEEKMRRLKEYSLAPSSPTETPSDYQNRGQEVKFEISSACQAAMIAQIRTEMSSFRDKMKNGEFTAKLDNILIVIDKLKSGTDGKQSGLELLKGQGLETAAMEVLFQPIIDDAQALKAFFAEMAAVMDAFFAIDDPEAAFAYLHNEFPREKPAAMGPLADRLVKNIKELSRLLKAVTEEFEVTTEGGNDGN